VSESEQTKRLYRKAFPSKPDVYVEPYWGEQLELSRRLDALEAAKGKTESPTMTTIYEWIHPDRLVQAMTSKASMTGKKEAGAHEAGCPAALCDGPCICRVAPPQPSNDLKDSVGERIVREFATRIESNHDAIIAAINAAVAEANTRAEKAEAEVKRLRDPVWLLSLWCPSPSQLREHFARHAKPKSLK